ncbi:hypothetical protein BSLG_010287 [Batrachochytrium salamandrivorans]|nr:hypothetical protein BSLG_010287 [Batrachochytrium salamandrivorans]
MFSATATATATTATATTTPTAATTPTATPSLFQQLWKKCKGLHSVFSPCGSSALSEESTENQAKPAYSSPLASSIISEVTAAAIHNAPVDARATQLKNAKFNITQIPWEGIYTPKSKPVKKHFNGSKEVTKVDSGVQMALPMETHDPSAKDVCVDWFKCTNITLTGVCIQPTLYMLARLSGGTMQIKYNDGDEDIDYPVLSIDYHSITSFEIFKCGRWRSKKLWAYDCRVVVTIPDKMTPRKNKVLTIWMHGPNESVALAKHVYDTLIDSERATCKFIRHF